LRCRSSSKTLRPSSSKLDQFAIKRRVFDLQLGEIIP
jgi:signal transduction histidine kinase